MDYWLDLLEVVIQIHITFHVSHLQKCLVHDIAVVPLDKIKVAEHLNYMERQVAILDRKTKTLCNKVVPLVKVQWKHHKRL